MPRRSIRKTDQNCAGDEPSEQQKKPLAKSPLKRAAKSATTNIASSWSETRSSRKRLASTLTNPSKQSKKAHSSRDVVAVDNSPEQCKASSPVCKSKSKIQSNPGNAVKHQNCGEPSQEAQERSADQPLKANRARAHQTPTMQGDRSNTIPNKKMALSNFREKSGLMVANCIPKSMKLVTHQGFSEDPFTACYYKGTTYIGLANKTLITVDGNFNRSDPLLTFDNFPYAVVVHNDLIYTAVYGEPCYTFHVHDLTGKHITSWNHSDYRSYHNNFAIVDNRIVMADRENQEFIVYSLTGEIIRRLPCPILGRATVAVSGVDESSIVVSDHYNCQVFRLDVITGDLIWLAKDIIWVESLTYYRGNVFAFVNAKAKRKQIWVFDAQTGKKLKVLKDSLLLKISYISDMHAHDDMLVIPRSIERDLMHYQLVY